VIAVPVFIRFGLYRAIFRYTGQAALVATAKAVTVYAVLLSAALVWLRWPMVPRSLGVLQPVIFLLLVGASRAFARFWLAGLAGPSVESMGRLLIFGAGTSGVQTATALGISRQYHLVGFVDDDLRNVGRSINGIPVLSAANVPQLVHDERITDVLLAQPDATRARRNAIIQSLEHLPVHVRTLPSMADLARGQVTVQDFRELDIEDLLGREPVAPRAELLALALAQQVVLVTGAGGSIGGELSRQIVQQHPRQLLLLDHNEFGLYSIHRELQELCADQALSVDLVPLLGNVTDRCRMQAICAQYQPRTVYHAAAYKHVPLVESNPGIGVLNNVMGTSVMAQVASESGVHRFVLVSTDKAVRPTNVMGATKRLAEQVLQALAQTPTATCFSMVRFGNVLDSSGSVVPLFRKQLASGGPLTVTHEEVTRYFMTIPEAAQLVLQAGAMGKGGDVFVLDMGSPVRILELAKRMLHLSGLSQRDANHPHGDIEIAITGLRPGEKLYEELLIGDNAEATEHPRIMKAHEPFLAWPALQQALAELQIIAASDDVLAIKAFLLKHVQGYQPSQPVPENS
jgi:FlaA1/EpsC-like NDP-sugar epimerase